MEPNEMERYSCRVNFPNGFDDVVSDKEGELVRYSDAMQIITALQSQIDGMIKRPVVEVKRTSAYDKRDAYEVTLNDRRMGLYGNRENALQQQTHLTTALGMDDAKEGDKDDAK